MTQRCAQHHQSNMMSDIVATAHLDQAFAAIYKRRRNDHFNSDLWAFSLNWPAERRKIQQALLQGCYQLSPVMAYRSAKGRLTRWSSRDAVVLKAISLQLTAVLDSHIDQRCYHLKGRGGLKAAVRAVARTQYHYTYVVKSDVADYYDSMNHQVVLAQCRRVIQDKNVLRIIAQYLNRVEVQEGEHSLIHQGIPKGCSLSP